MSESAKNYQDVVLMAIIGAGTRGISLEEVWELLGSTVFQYIFVYERAGLDTTKRFAIDHERTLKSFELQLDELRKKGWVVEKNARLVVTPEGKQHFEFELKAKYDPVSISVIKVAGHYCSSSREKRELNDRIANNSKRRKEFPFTPLDGLLLYGLKDNKKLFSLIYPEVMAEKELGMKGKKKRKSKE